MESQQHRLEKELARASQEGRRDPEAEKATSTQGKQVIEKIPTPRLILSWDGK